MLHNYDKLNIKFSHYQDPKPGMMLISSPILKDKNFKKAVILICEVNKKGTFGVILNKTLQINLADVLSEISKWNSPLYLGGPVKENSLNFIHNQFEEVAGSKYISEDIAWGGCLEDLEEKINEDTLSNINYKFFVGYSGWEQGQLEFEIKEKAWFVSNMNRKLIFENDDTQIWNKAIIGLEKKYHLLLKYPDDPSLN